MDIVSIVMILVILSVIAGFYFLIFSMDKNKIKTYAEENTGEMRIDDE